MAQNFAHSGEFFCGFGMTQVAHESNDDEFGWRFEFFCEFWISHFVLAVGAWELWSFLITT